MIGAGWTAKFASRNDPPTGLPTQAVVLFPYRARIEPDKDLPNRIGSPALALFGMVGSVLSGTIRTVKIPS